MFQTTTNMCDVALLITKLHSATENKESASKIHTTYVEDIDKDSGEVTLVTVLL